MRNQHAAILLTADGTQVAQAELKNVVVELPAFAVCDEIEHHFSTWTISLKAPHDVDLAIDTLP